MTDRIWVDEEVCGQAGKARSGSPALLLRSQTQHRRPTTSLLKLSQPADEEVAVELLAMNFDSRKPNNPTATLATYARHTFSGFPAILKRSVKAVQAGSLRPVSTEAFHNRASSPSVTERQSSPSTTATGFFEAQENDKSARHSENVQLSSVSEDFATDIQPPRQSKAAQVFQHFFETDHVRDEELRLICRRDRAVGVFVMVFWSLAAEGLGQVGQHSTMVAIASAGTQEG